MSAVEVPAERAAQFADTIDSISREVHATLLHPHPFAECQKGSCPYNRSVAAELRALLPQPAPTCPNCGQPDENHPGYTATMTRDCPFPRATLGDLRALLAAERDSKPAQREPRVWDGGDPEPGHDVQTVIDNDHDTWHRTSAGWRCDRIDDESNWARVVWRFGPLTEVLPGGAS